MSIELAVAPPDGWNKWSKTKLGAYFDQHPPLSIMLSSYETFNLFRLTVWQQLEQGALGSRFPAFDRLTLERRWLGAGDIPALIEDLKTIRDELGVLPLNKVVSPDAYLTRLDFSLPKDEFEAQHAKVWKDVLSGTIAFSPLSSSDLAYQRQVFRLSHPPSPPLRAGDLFPSILRGMRFVALRARQSSRGVVLS